MTTSELVQARSEAFAERMLGVLNDAALALMTSVGHRTGLFDAMAGLPPSTSEKVASAAGLNERYVREWLAAMVVAALRDHILPLVPGLTERLQTGIDVLDVGCGSGRAMNLLARRFPNSRFVGHDFSEEAIACARAEAEEHGTANVRFEVKDATVLGKEARYDLVTTFDAIHDQAKPAAVLKGIADALRADGVYLMQDIAGSSHLQNNMDHPLGPFMYAISTMHCMTVSLAQGGEGLGTMWGEEKALEMLEEAGFGEVRVERLPHDFQNSYYIAKKG